MNTYECCGYRVPGWVFEFLEVNDFSVRAAALICRLYNFVQCNNTLELVSVLTDVASGRLPLRYCGRRTQAEIAEKLGLKV
jgi:hypothetical protein